MLFPKANKIVPNLNLQISELDFEKVENFTFLGLTVDQYLTWRSHIYKIPNKISKICAIFAKLKKYDISAQNIIDHL